ncbi:uncharacterized protein NFIA_112540 [Aspergillus fischeri NRRL 181]|uniref:Uncharacterized protein n=1 Tax=Neosartorya fischeri (strain ATCC 1020 / DSM 3700 / CBS 544.65 / FGSC A1164 / JCM 1740 / NRRL 181 / WB 181) TaxID=331117 RepID=A1D8L9_NEOFI|nr:uncharacterized protein NFIA_112540 [Aspergillus fischeri NRRL 181]EAW20730.1 hypothetical protein NFIA_112540 [Aspergillus fischeri NRRL 181]
MPGGHTEGVCRLPFQRLASDFRATLAGGDMINSGQGVLPARRRRARIQPLYIALCGLIALRPIQPSLHLVSGKDNGRARRVDILGLGARLAKVLDKMDRKVSEVGQIQAVQPDHRAAAILAMVMVVPGIITAPSSCLALSRRVRSTLIP